MTNAAIRLSIADAYSIRNALRESSGLATAVDPDGIPVGVMMSVEQYQQLRAIADLFTDVDKSEYLRKQNYNFLKGKDVGTELDTKLGLYQYRNNEHSG